MPYQVEPLSWFQAITLMAIGTSQSIRHGTWPPDPFNLIRDSLRSHLFDPRNVSHSYVMIKIEIAHHKLSELAKDAPALRRQHLLNIQKSAEDWGDSICSANILEILIWEQERKNGGK